MEKNKRNDKSIKIISKKELFLEIFYVFSAAIFIFIILEYFFPGIVLAYININIVLILWLIVGIVLVVL